VICNACAEAAQAMGRLDTLSDLEPYWIEVSRLENQADQICRRILSRLFSGEYDVLAMLKIRGVPTYRPQPRWLPGSTISSTPSSADSCKQPV